MRTKKNLKGVRALFDLTRKQRKDFFLSKAYWLAKEQREEKKEKSRRERKSFKFNIFLSFVILIERKKGKKKT